MEFRRSPQLSSEQQKMADENNQKINNLFESFERGGGQPAVQEAKLKVKDLSENLERFKEDPRTRDDEETIKWYETEIKLWQRQADGKSIEGETEEEKEEYKRHVNAADEKKLKETREHLNNLKML